MGDSEEDLQSPTVAATRFRVWIKLFENSVKTKIIAL